MNKFQRHAYTVQRDVAAAEREKLYSDTHSEESTEAAARQASVMARQDIVLLVCYLSHANEQLSTIRRLLWVMVIVLIGFAFKYG